MRVLTNYELIGEHNNSLELIRFLESFPEKRVYTVKVTFKKKVYFNFQTNWMITSGLNC